MTTFISKRAGRSTFVMVCSRSGNWSHRCQRLCKGTTDGKDEIHGSELLHQKDDCRF